MKKYILLSLFLSSLLFISACSSKDNEYKEDDIIDFSGEESKFKYCSKNIDKSTCSFYRPLVLVYVKHVEGVSPCSAIRLKNTDTCKTYVYTTSFKEDYRFLIDYCSKHRDIPKCSFTFDVIKEIMYYKDM